MYSKFAYCSIITENEPKFIIYPEYNTNEKILIIENILDYFNCYLENKNMEYLKILVFMEDDFKIINIGLVINSYIWDYIFVIFNIDENKKMIFDNIVSVFNMNLLNSYCNIKKIMNTETPIITAIRQLSKFIIVEKKGIVHIPYYNPGNENNKSQLIDKCYILPLFININIMFIKEIQYKYPPYNNGIIIIYENGIISFISDKKILLGFSSLHILTYIDQQYLERTRVDIDKNNICLISHRCRDDCKINMFLFYYLEILICFCLKKNTINMYIVKYIMISLFNNKYDLQLFNILIEEYLQHLQYKIL
jgi:hypothetical protein